MNINFQENYFAMFQLEPKFQLDAGRLDAGYHEFQSRCHPDKTAHLGAAEKRLSLQWATLANEAYRTLKRPLERARHLLLIHGVETPEDDHTAISVEFLLAQMECREALREAVADDDLLQLQTLERRVKAEIGDLLQLLADLLDLDHRYQAAAELVRRMLFLDKLAAEINDAYELLER